MKKKTKKLLKQIEEQREKNLEGASDIVDWYEWAKILASKPSDNSSPEAAGIPLVNASWAKSELPNYDALMLFKDQAGMMAIYHGLLDYESNSFLQGNHSIFVLRNQLLGEIKKVLTENDLLKYIK